MIGHTKERGIAGNGYSPMLQNLIQYIPFVIAAVGFVCCLVIELMHIDISKENRDWVYANIGTMSFNLCILLNTAHGRNYGFGWFKSLLFSFLSFQLVFSYVSVGWANLDIRIFGGGAVASYRSLMFLPLLCMILSRFCKVDILNLCDFLTPYFLFHHGLVTLPCWIEGCCAGRPWSWGLMNPLSGMIVFPTQPCIVILSLTVSFWGLQYSKMHAYKTNGIVFANSLCIYGFFRYLIELYTDDTRIWWVLSWLAVCALAMIVQGLLVRYFVKKHYKTP